MSPFIRLLAGALLVWAVPGLAQVAPPATNAAPAGAMAPQVDQLLSQASEFAADGNLEQAAIAASTAIQLDPKNATAYETRGSIYIQEKVWERADRDYAMADHLAPEPAYKFKLGEIKFLQKSYEDARSRFARLQDDPDLGELATYKMFLCDLLGVHDAAGLRDLAALDQASTKGPAYYFCHAAWNLFHNNRPEANRYLTAAAHSFDASTNNLYISVLIATENYQPDIASFVTVDGREFSQAHVYLEDDGLRASTPTNTWVTIPVDQLPTDLSPFPQDLRTLIFKKRDAAALKGTPAPLDSRISFATKSGKSFDEVHWMAEDAGLSVLGHSGWVDIPYAQLPDDLSTFPQDLQDQIKEKRHLAAPCPTTPTHTELVTLTTTTGVHYDNARAFLAEDKLHILGQNGWDSIPLAQLPADVSALPLDWRARIISGRTAPTPDDTPVVSVVSFKTKKGTSYSDVRASMAMKDIRVLTYRGWVAVPFSDLPVDLSPFPEGWRKVITDRQSSVHPGTVNP